MRPVIPLILIFAYDACLASATNSDRNYTASEWWLVYLTGLLSAFTLGLMLFTAKLWRTTLKLSEDAQSNAERQRQDTVKALESAERAAHAAERSADVSSQALTASQRAFVFWKGFNCGLHIWDGKLKEYVVFAEAENVGVTPALDVRVAVHLQIVRGSAPQAPLFSEDSNVMSSATVLGPKAGLRSSMLTISVSDLVDCWENKGEIFVWAYIQYRDIFESTKVHHHQQCAKLALIHEPTTAPPDGHPPYLQFMSFGAQNTAS